MKKTIKFPELIITLSNEEEGEGGWYGWEGGTEFENLSVEISLSDFCELSNEKFSLLKNWLINNAVFHIKAAVHDRNEREMKLEAQRRERDKTQQQQKKQKVGYVYLVAADNGLHKIGRSINVDKRVTEFGIKLPMKTWLVHSFKSNKYDHAEAYLHQVFAEKRSHGEWFNLTQEDVDYICSIKDEQL